MAIVMDGNMFYDDEAEPDPNYDPFGDLDYDNYPLTPEQAKLTDEEIHDLGLAYCMSGLSSVDMVRYFQHLIDTGTCWRTAGEYGRTAQDLIDAELCEFRLTIVSLTDPDLKFFGTNEQCLEFAAQHGGQDKFKAA